MFHDCIISHFSDGFEVKNSDGDLKFQTKYYMKCFVSTLTTPTYIIGDSHEDCLRKFIFFGGTRYFASYEKPTRFDIPVSLHKSV